MPRADVLPLASAIEGSPARKWGCAPRSGDARGPPSPRSTESCAVYIVQECLGPSVRTRATIASRTRATIAEKPSKPSGLTGPQVGTTALVQQDQQGAAAPPCWPRSCLLRCWQHSVRTEVEHQLEAIVASPHKDTGRMPLQLTRQQQLLRESMRRERPARSARTALRPLPLPRRGRKRSGISGSHDPEMNAEAEGESCRAR